MARTVVIVLGVMLNIRYEPQVTRPELGVYNHDKSKD
jgi:hypothetical protein